MKTRDYEHSENNESALLNKHSLKTNVRDKTINDQSVPRCYECNKPLCHYGKNCYKCITRLKKEGKNQKDKTRKKDSSQKTFCTVLFASAINWQN